jgi:hypothetical protein
MQEEIKNPAALLHAAGWRERVGSKKSEIHSVQKNDKKLC